MYVCEREREHYNLPMLVVFMAAMLSGWMYEARGRGGSMSFITKLWIVTVKLLTRFSRPMLYSYQGSLPRLPLPGLNQTMSRVRCAVHSGEVMGVSIRDNATVFIGRMYGVYQGSVLCSNSFILIFI